MSATKLKKRRDITYGKVHRLGIWDPQGSTDALNSTSDWMIKLRQLFQEDGNFLDWLKLRRRFGLCLMCQKIALHNRISTHEGFGPINLELWTWSLSKNQKPKMEIIEDKVQWENSFRQVKIQTILEQSTNKPRNVLHLLRLKNEPLGGSPTALSISSTIHYDRK